jgi:crotonobetainyl-CoA:carnitine CoA-transferase CaiB-like acyl-CoA transferase
MILEGGDPAGRPLRFIASPIHMSGAKAGLRREPPKLGQHTAEVLAEARALIDGGDA